jgi:integrase
VTHQDKTWKQKIMNDEELKSYAFQRTTTVITWSAMKGMPLVAALGDFQAQLVQSGRAANTVNSYMRCLRKWESKGQRQEPAEYLESIQSGGRSPATASLTRAALIQFFDYLEQAHPSLKLGNPWRLLDFPGTRPVRVQPLPIPVRKPKSYDEPGDARNLAIAMMILEAGIKPSELRNLRVGSVDFQAQELYVQPGGNLSSRRCRLSPELVQVLEQMLHRRGVLVTDSDAYLFTCVKEPYVGKPLTRESVFRACRSACRLNTRELRKCFAAAVHTSDVTDNSFKTAMGYKSAFGAWLARQKLQNALDSKRMADEQSAK